MYWFRDCTKAMESEKEELKKQMCAAKSSKRSRLKRLSECLPKPDRFVTINGVLELPCCPNTGSDFTIMGPSHWEQLRALDPSVGTKTLEIPIRNQTFGSRWVTAEKKACLRGMIHTAVGPQLAWRDDGETSGDPIVLEADEIPARESTTYSTESNAIFAAVEKMVESAVANGFPTDKVEQLRTIVHAYDVWRLELRDDPPAKVPPLEVRLWNGALPTKCKPRKYPPHIRQFLHDFNAHLVELGLVYDNPNSCWTSPVLPVKKSDDLIDLRLTTDFRAGNEETEAMAAVMPILSLVMEHARGVKLFGLFDFLKGFWQLPLAEICQEFLSYVTDEKIVTPRRAPQGCRDAPIFSRKQWRTVSPPCYARLIGNDGFPHDTATTCLFTDASDVGWAVIVTQVDNCNPTLPVTQQQHKLLQCMSGTFTGSQLNWTVIEKEAFPIVMACDKLDYLLLRPQPFRMYCDHHNLIHVFAPDDSVKKHVRGKLLHWAIKLMKNRYVIQHVPASDNVWADMISRWAGNHVPTARPTTLLAFRGRQASPNCPPVSILRPLDDENFVWPTLTELADVQSQFSPPVGAVHNGDGLVTVADRIWIPPEAHLTPLYRRSLWCL
ncbi:unnamed protein product [Phytophthora fragariaefolia]|uniref:Unnamed protein product n=1 Tax=Phytophthora fragariaefolia TaxID=1490495 RepID=A0A9W6Y202_9STRA|nr:unnamed protein product [Phytophthora fragariaefolia]